jgi:hypothetical protein
MKRRHFLEFTLSALATLGMSRLDFCQQGQRYARVLAQNTSRKLALLIGINDYTETSAFAKLYGCVTDVELQRELLTYRFGFNPKDILTLTDAQATREGMLTAFEEHLIKQARAGDVVAVHYSGHGSRVRDPDGDHPDGLNSTFVPIDSSLPAGFPEQGGIVQDIMGHTLFLLMKAISTDNLTVVLDCCHSGGGTRGNLRVRAREGGSQLQASPAELAYQEQWLSKLNLSPDTFRQQRRAGIAKGVAIASAKREQLAADAPFSDFDAGVFTYLLTQYLWQQTGTEGLSNTLPNVARSTTRLSTQRQEPGYEVRPGSEAGSQPLYFLQQTVPPADAVLRKVEGKQVELWLGGIDPQSMAAFDQGAIFTAVDLRGENLGEVQLESRQGLIGRGELSESPSSGRIQAGALLQEQVRNLPPELQLVVGLDPALGSEVAKARQALEGIPRLRAVPLHQEAVHYIFGPMVAASYEELWERKSPDEVPPTGSLGLLTVGGDPLPGSFSTAGESVADAVTRLRPKLKSLLAAQMVKLALNVDSSRLNLVVAMTTEGQETQLLAEVFPTRGINQTSEATPQPQAAAANLRRLPLGTAVQFQVSNREPYELYLSLLVIDPTGEMNVIFPNNWTASEEATRIGAGQSVRIPDPSRDSFQLVTQTPKGIVEVLIVASRAPLRQALKGMQAIASRGGQSRGPVPLTDSVEVIASLLQDLQQGSRSRGSNRGGLGTVERPLDTTQLATMSLTFEVI